MQQRAYHADLIDDGEIDAYSRRNSAWEWLSNRTFGAAFVAFFTALLLWVMVLLVGFEFFLRNVVIERGIDAAFSSFGLIISFIYADYYKRWQTKKHGTVQRYYAARHEMRELMFIAVRSGKLTIDEALLFHVALYEAFNREFVYVVYRAQMCPGGKAMYEGDDLAEMERVLGDRTRFLGDWMFLKRARLMVASNAYALLSRNLLRVKSEIEVPVPRIYQLHTYALFFIALFLLLPFVSWHSVGVVLAAPTVTFVLFMLFVPFVVDAVIGDTWNPARTVQLGAHEVWFKNDVAECNTVLRAELQQQQKNE